MLVAGASHQLTSAVIPVSDLEIEALEDGIASNDEEELHVVVATKSCDETFKVDQLQEHFADSDHDSNHFQVEAGSKAELSLENTILCAILNIMKTQQDLSGSQQQFMRILSYHYCKGDPAL